MPSREGTYGLLAEFDTPGDLVRAAHQARNDGWRRMDCYTPYPVEEAAEAIGFHRNKVPLVTLIGGLMGVAAMFSLETWISVLAYPLNIARTPDSIPGRPSLCPHTSGRFCGRVCRRPSACSRSTDCRRSIIRCSMRRTSATEQRPTSSSFALRRWIRSLILIEARDYLEKL